MRQKNIAMIVFSILLIFSFAGCAIVQNDSGESTTLQATDSGTSTSDIATEETDSSNSLSSISSVDGSVLDTSELFTERDLEQSPDLTDAVYIELESGEDVVISEEGIYVLSGDVTDVTVEVEAAEDAKVQIVLNGVSIVNEDSPAIYVKSADKVFVTTTDSENYLEVSGTYTADGDVNLDAVIFSKSDLVLNGTGSLEVVSAEGNGITSKDDLKITGGTYTITSAADSIEANDSIRIYAGYFTIVTGKDGLHSENEEDASLGYIYIYDGTFDISAADDGIQGTPSSRSTAA
jgi:hypothetical protein